jgi:hypothetical protein
MCTAKEGVDCLESIFFLALPRFPFFLFRLNSVFFVFDGIFIPPVHAHNCVVCIPVTGMQTHPKPILYQGHKHITKGPFLQQSSPSQAANTWLTFSDPYV